MIDKEHWCYDCKHRTVKTFIGVFDEKETFTSSMCDIDGTHCSGTYRCRYKEEVE